VPDPFKPSPHTAKDCDDRVIEMYGILSKSPGNILHFDDDSDAFYCWTGVVWLRNEGMKPGVVLEYD